MGPGSPWGSPGPGCPVQTRARFRPRGEGVRHRGAKTARGPFFFFGSIFLLLLLLIYFLSEKRFFRLVRKEM